MFTGHIGLNVTDLDRSRDFYQRVFGLTAHGEGEDGDRRWTFLADGSGAVAVTLWQQSAGSFATGTPGLHHLAFSVDSLAEVRAAQETLRALGVELVHGGVVGHADGLESGGIFFTDPDGIRLEISTADAEGAAAPSSTAPTCGFF
ncbi:VOC family protein [Streptomyces sp. SL13]|jgi:catechol 2,3-dioxygenase-like lactoylglutathione lyase family enzyme|uniref:VOC family protein n=1 Tax=Streptantibioticus silvisoli TaxID=2705255 RepID=A0AA90H6G1_9ACTN|nr:VOC family protein [Streptantibioticus silvisoli]MDI5963816.1 VOC family protein [Streptantibioticus silvisoli]MDI5972801.1 VOC family protein [Streptantibioticus silvisoli]